MNDPLKRIFDDLGRLVTTLFYYAWTVCFLVAV